MLMWLSAMRFPVGVKYKGSIFDNICRVEQPTRGTWCTSSEFSFTLQPADHLNHLVRPNLIRTSTTVTLLSLAALNHQVSDEASFVDALCEEGRKLQWSRERLVKLARKIFDVSTKYGRFGYGKLPATYVVPDDTVKLGKLAAEDVLVVQFPSLDAPGIHLVVSLPALRAAMRNQQNIAHRRLWEACENPAEYLLASPEARSHAIRVMQRERGYTSFMCGAGHATATVSGRWNSMKTTYQDKAPVYLGATIFPQLTLSLRRLSHTLASVRSHGRTKKRKRGDDVDLRYASDILSAILRSAGDPKKATDISGTWDDAHKLECRWVWKVKFNNRVLYVTVEITTDPFVDHRRRELLREGVGSTLPPDLVAIISELLTGKVY